MYDFVGVGGLAYDLVLSVDHLPLDDDKYPAALVGRLPGGFIANATCAAARLGLRCGYAGWAGQDAEGDMLHDDFVRWGVDPAGLLHDPDEPTPFTVVVGDSSGARSILLPSFALYRQPLTGEQIALAQQARVVYTFPRDALWCRQLADAAQAGQGILALDVEGSIPLRGDALRAAVRRAGVVFVTETSLPLLGGRSISDLVEGDQWVILTAGSRGAYGIRRGMDAPVFQAALPVAVVDTTGAGDCFHAALIAARLDGATLAESLRFANAAAALAVQQRGARGGLPSRDAVEALL
jgi:sugar/nucleoside kinase (ribokinase family)